MIAIEKEIDSVVRDNDNASEWFVNPEEGTDEYLDKALEQQKRFRQIAQRLQALNDLTIAEFNRDREATYKVLPAMKSLLAACERNLAILNGSTFAKAVASTIDAFQRETDRLEDNISDFVLIQETIEKDDEWAEIMSKL